jgi:hypothetical protein
VISGTKKTMNPFSVKDSFKYETADVFPAKGPPVIQILKTEQEISSY